MLGMVFDHTNHERKLKQVRNKSEVHLGFLSDLPKEKSISSQYIKSKDLTCCS